MDQSPGLHAIDTSDLPDDSSDWQDTVLIILAYVAAIAAVVILGGVAAGYLAQKLGWL